MKRVLLALFGPAEQAERAVRDLQASGFADASIGLLMPERASQSRRDQGKDEAALETPVADTQRAAVGAAPGRPTGVILAETTALANPGPKPIITAGLLNNPISGSAGWLTASLSGTDLSRYEATYYEGRIALGMSLVVVMPDGREILAREILARHGGALRSGSAAGQWQYRHAVENRSQSTR